MDTQLKLRAQTRREEGNQKDQEKADYVQANWSDQGKIRDYVWTWSILDFEGVIDLVSTKKMKKTLRKFKKERTQEMDRASKAKYKAMARNIESAYLDRSQMKGLLRTLFTWERREVMVLLSAEIRKYIAEMSSLLTE